MSFFPRPHLAAAGRWMFRPTWDRFAPIVAGIAIGGLVFGSPGAIAQDGTSGAPPLTETGCLLVPASPVDALIPAEPVGATPVGTPMATPVDASPVATPIGPGGATPVAAAPQVDEALLLEDLTAAATAITSCLSEERYQDLADRTSPLFRGQLIGIQEPIDSALFASLAATFPDSDYSIVEIGEPELADETGTMATAEIIWQVGQQVRVDEWTFVRGVTQGVPVWVLDRAAPGALEPEIAAEPVAVTIADNAYSLESESMSGDAVRFDVTNTDSTEHELLVLRMDGDADTGDLLTTPGPNLPEGITFVGQATVPAESSGQLLLVDLEPGEYAIVCLLPNENGVPHLANGMETTFEIDG